jgi:tRNA U34 5-carboxymethylaminomethyl modifying enzyme MnmG/GidA
LCALRYGAKGEENGEILRASQVIITTGTFLGGEIHIGEFTVVPP